MSSDPTSIIVVDTREPVTGSWADYFTVPCVRQTLQTGDYSILGAEHMVAVERKSLPDLLQSLTRERDRFERELARGKALNFFTVVIEASAADFRTGKFGPHAKGVKPKAVWESVAAFSVRYCPFVFGHDKPTSARLCESLLIRWRKERTRAEQAQNQRWEVVDSWIAQASITGPPRLSRNAGGRTLI